MVKVFTVYDSKVETYLQPFQARTKGEAIRSFADAVMDQKSQISQHPEDFTLFEIATYDDTTGVYTSLDAKISLGCAIEFKKD